MSSPEENFMHWLRDAHAMEKQAIESFENQQKRLENYPEMSAWVRDHVDSAHKHRDLIRQCIERRGGSASSLKDVAMTIMGKVQEVTGALAADEVLKNVITDSGFKHYQIACYTSLIAAAEEVGDSETARMCEGILQTQKQQADQLLPLIPALTRKYMQRDAAEVAAKR